MQALQAFDPSPHLHDENFFTSVAYVSWRRELGEIHATVLVVRALGRDRPPVADSGQLALAILTAVVRWQ